MIQSIKSFLKISLSSLVGIVILLSCDKDDNVPVDDVKPLVISIDDFSTSIDENPTSETVLGKVSGDFKELDVTFMLKDERPAGAMTIKESTRELVVADTTLWDFETNPEIKATVVATSGEKEVTGSVVITLKDVKELNVGKNGLIAYYSFDNKTLSDSLSNFPDLISAGDGKDPRPDFDRNGDINAIIFESGKHLKLPSQDALVDQDKTFSLSVWVYPQGTRQVMQTILHKKFDYELRVSPGEYISPVSYYSAITYGIAGDDPNKWGKNLRLSRSNAVNFGSSPRRLRWSHLAIVCDGKSVSVYLNGGKIYTDDLQSDKFVNSGHDLLIGASTDEKGDITAKYLGTVDDLRYYNRALTDSQVKALAEVSAK